MFMGIFDHSSRSAFVRSHTDVGWEGPALSLHSNSSQRHSVGLRSGLCAGHPQVQLFAACLGACIYTPVAMDVIGTPDFNYLDG